MSNFANELCGVAQLQTITPVIRALFSAYVIDEHSMSKGYFEFYKDEEEDKNGEWESLHDSLTELCEELKIVLPEEDTDVVGLIRALAHHYQADGNQKLQAVLKSELIYEIDTIDLFIVAEALDDGHGLKSIRVEGAHGGGGSAHGHQMFAGKHFMSASNTSYHQMIAREIDSALARQNVEEAAQIISNKIELLLAGLSDPKTFKMVTDKVAEQLAQATR